MLRIKKNQNESVWISYSNEAEFLIRPLTASSVEKIRKQFVKSKIGNKNGEVTIIEVVDDEKFNDALIDYIIEDWKGIGDEDGNDLDCNLENKKLVMDISEISEFILTAAKKLPMLSKNKIEAEIKN